MSWQSRLIHLPSALARGGVRACRRAAMGLAGSLLAASAQAQETLTCTSQAGARWHDGTFHAAESGFAADIGIIVHLDPASGEWYLALEGSAALVVDGGRFEIVRDGADYPEEWVGFDADGGNLLNITLRVEPHTFLFFQYENVIYTGLCTVPDEPFLFLSQSQTQSSSTQ